MKITDEMMARAKDAIHRLRDYGDPNDHAIARAVLTAALSQGQDGTVEVKPLEWRESGDWTAVLLADLYRIEDQGRNWPTDRYWLDFNEHRLGKFDTLDEAKAAAQADYEKRILSALTTPPPQGEVAENRGCHPSHTTRMSDASSFDEVCVKCGATDITGGGWGKLAEPCPVQGEQAGAEPVAWRWKVANQGVPGWHWGIKLIGDVPGHIYEDIPEKATPEPLYGPLK